MCPLDISIFFQPYAKKILCITYVISNDRNKKKKMIYSGV